MSDSFPGNRPEKRPTIVIVDDEVMVTESLRSMLTLETEYRVHAFQSSQAALEYLKMQPADLVISDFLMPEMNGLQFLGEVKRIYPDVPRVILTGYADKENAIRAINEIGLYQYIEKPWDNDQLKLIIRNALASKSLTELLRNKVRELDEALRDRAVLFEREGVLRRELELARRVQQKLLPQSLPQSDYLTFEAVYHPIMEVGGDFYDIVRLADDGWAVLLADVTGHGIQAALSTALLKFAFSTFAGSRVAPSEILAGMNAILRKGLPHDIYVAALVLTFHPATGRCTLVNGGLPYPFVLRRGERRTDTVPASGLLLGFADEETYRPGDESRIHLDAGDCLIAYTDGLSDATNDCGEQFGDGPLDRELARVNGQPCDHVLNHLWQTAEEYRRGDTHKDDITLFGIEMH